MLAGFQHISILTFKPPFSPAQRADTVVTLYSCQLYSSLVPVIGLSGTTFGSRKVDPGVTPGYLAGRKQRELARLEEGSSTFPPVAAGTFRTNLSSPNIRHSTTLFLLQSYQFELPITHSTKIDTEKHCHYEYQSHPPAAEALVETNRRAPSVYPI